MLAAGHAGDNDKAQMGSQDADGSELVGFGIGVPLEELHRGERVSVNRARVEQQDR